MQTKVSFNTAIVAEFNPATIQTTQDKRGDAVPVNGMRTERHILKMGKKYTANYYIGLTGIGEVQVILNWGKLHATFNVELKTNSSLKAVGVSEFSPSNSIYAKALIDGWFMQKNRFRYFPKGVNISNGKTTKLNCRNDLLQVIASDCLALYNKTWNKYHAVQSNHEAAKTENTQPLITEVA